MLGLGYRNTTFLVEDENLFRNRDLSSTTYSIKLTNYYYKKTEELYPYLLQEVKQ